MNGHVVLTDNNPQLPRAMFFGAGSEEAAIEWRDAHAGGAAVRPITVASYNLIVTLP